MGQAAPPQATPRRSAVALAAILALAGVARVPTLGLRRVVEGDGVHYAGLARDIMAGDLSGIVNPYWSNLWPAAIAVTSTLTGLDVVEAGRLTSLASGILLAPATALLAARILGPLAGLAAGLAVAGHPWLIHFSTLVFTESFFGLLLVLLLLAGTRAIRSSSGRDAALVGVLAGSAIVTRPEALSTLLVVLAFVGLRLVRAQGWGVASRRVALALALAGSFLALRATVCYHFYDVLDLGIGSKGTANLLLGLAEDDAAKERLSNEINADGSNRLDQEVRHSSLFAFAFDHRRLVAVHTLKNLGRLAASVRDVFPPLPVSLGRSALPSGGPLPMALALLAPATLLLAGIGLVEGLRDSATRAGSLLLLAAIGLYFLGIAPLNVHYRLVVSPTPLLLIFFGHGLARSLRLITERGAIAATALLLVTGTLSTFAVLHAPALAYGDDPLAQKQAGLWLLEHAGRDTKVMTPSPAIAFYLYDSARKENEIDMPWAPYDQMLSLARREGVQLVAAPEWYLEAARFPAAPQLLSAEGDHPGLQHLATVGAPRPYRVFIYRLLPEPAS